MLLLSLFPCCPVEDTLTRTVRPSTRSRTNTSIAPFVSPRTSFRDVEAKATNLPVEEIEPRTENAVEGWPFSWTSAMTVVAVSSSRAYTWKPATGGSIGPFESKATKRPSAEIDGMVLSAST